MANSTISGLTNAGTLTGTERVPIVQGGSTVDCTTQAIGNLSSARVLLDTKTGTGSSGTISFTSIPSTYNAVEIVFLGRSTAAASTDSIYVQVNGDTGNNYSRQIDWSNNSTATAYGTSGSPSGYPGYMPAASASAGAYGVMRMIVPFYAESTFSVIGSQITFAFNNAANATYRMDATSVWHNTAALNRIDLNLLSANWTTGTKARLYGIT